MFGYQFMSEEEQRVVRFCLESKIEQWESIAEAMEKAEGAFYDDSARMMREQIQTATRAMAHVDSGRIAYYSGDR